MSGDHNEGPAAPGDSVEIAALAPRHARPHFPTVQIIGYAVSLILTLIAFAMTHNRWLALSPLVTMILVLAFVQAAVQMGVFMHLREGRGTLWHLPVLGLALFIALGLVGFSIWIMLFKSGVS